MHLNNEIIILASLLVIYSGVVLWFWLFGKKGLMCFTVIATIAANIEVLILVDAFGMEQTLGNIIFASTFLVSDILSELYGKGDAKKAVHIGIATSITFVILTQSWLLYTPSENDVAFTSIQTIFSGTPRIMFASLLVYAICQRFDVWAYERWWNLTKSSCGDKRKYLWFRNNASTLLSQFVNAALFTIIAFVGKYDSVTLISIFWSSYIIFIITSIADTPFVYLARYVYETHKMD